MTNLAESNSWELGIYQIETTDPVVGGADGISNVQAKQLANRTVYLKLLAEVALADAVALGPDMQSMVDATLMFALDQAGQADWGVRALREQWQQEGELRLTNRGIVSGCVPVKNISDITIDAGICFATGLQHSATGGSFGVPISTTDTLVYSFYLRPAASGYATFMVSGAPPDDGILICTVSVPPNAVDLTSATMVDERRIEPDFPVLINTPAEEYVAINPLSAGDWRFDVDVVSALGAPCGKDAITLASRAGNGMTVRLLSAADDVVVRWRVSKLNN